MLLSNIGVNMAFSELDRKRYAQLGALLKKAKFDINIEEIMAAAQAYSWLAQLPSSLEASASAPAIAQDKEPKAEDSNVSNKSIRRQK